MRPRPTDADLREALIDAGVLVPQERVGDPPWVRRLPCLALDAETREKAEKVRSC